jgi:outer membrane protein assembly factor BamB
MKIIQPHESRKQTQAAASRAASKRVIFVIAVLLCLALFGHFIWMLAPQSVWARIPFKQTLQEEGVPASSAPIQPVSVSVINFAELAAKGAKASEKIHPKGAPVLRAVHPPKSITEGDSAVAERPASASSQGNEIHPLVSSPAPSQSFLAQEDGPEVGTGTFDIPPDTMGAVGPDKLFVNVNSNYRVQDKTTGAALSTVSIATFWASSGVSGVFDPRVQYDPYNQRWILAATSNSDTANSSIVVGISATSDPQGTFTLFRFTVGCAAGSANCDASGETADFPMLGFNKNWVAISWNQFQIGGSGSFVAGKMIAIDYPTLRTGTANSTVFTVTQANNIAAFCMHPATTLSATEDALYVPAHISSASATYRLHKLTGTPAAPVYMLDTISKTRTGGGWTPPGGDILPQTCVGIPGSTCPTTQRSIDSGDAFIRSNVVFRDGNVWYAQTVGLPAGGLTHTGAQWTRIDTSGNFVDGGRVEDPTATSSSGEWYAYPSIAVNANNDVLLGFSNFAATHFARASYALRQGTDAAGTMRDPVIFKEGEDYYAKDFGGSRNRWGDYSHTVVDPSNDQDMWTIQEYAGLRAFQDSQATTNNSRWGTWWAKVPPGGPPPTPTPTPSPTPTPAPTPTPTASGQAVAYQIDPAHSGFQSDGITPPLTTRWSRNLGGWVSYPLIAGGRVFVTVANQSTYGTKLYALDEATGSNSWGPIDLPGTYYWSGIAYDAGRVFALNFDGLLRAFDAASGAPLWSRQLSGQYAFSSPPTAVGGAVYAGGAGSAGTLYAVAEQDGIIKWRAGVENGDHSSPAVSTTGVFVSYACNQAYDFSPSTGALIWHHSSSCEGGGGKTPVLFGSRLYVRDTVLGNLVLDAATGAELGGVSTGPAPALSGSAGYFLTGSTLQARDVTSGAVRWSFTGDGTLSSAPIIDNSYVYIGSRSGKLYALDATTGANVWTGTVGAAVNAPDEQNVSQPLTGLGAGDGLVVVPASTLLVAYQSSRTVQFSSSTYTVSETAPRIDITLTRAGDTTSSASVNYTTIDNAALQNCNVKNGTASPRCDYLNVLGTMNFAAGETSRSFSVAIIDDTYAEGNETFTVRLENPSGAGLGTESTATVTITDNDAVDGPNPLDTAGFFVRQHYLDFLNREPDQSGLDYWSGQVTQCGADQSCIRSKRIDVSNAFFYELEYQQTAAYVIRLYRAAFGNNQPFPNPDSSSPTEAKKIPSYAVFSNDRARLIGSANLGPDQLALANAFVQRPEVLSKYPSSLSLDQFVDAMLATILGDDGVDLSSQRAALIALGNRGAVLYRIADDNSQTNPINNRPFIDAEYNRAFVASQYFGYLRRDSDIEGFLFWLGQVSSGPLRDVGKQHAMVCAFITSAEYQQRVSSVVTHTNSECPH